MIQGILPIGSVFKKEGSSQYDYYISPKLFWEYTGCVYIDEPDGKETLCKLGSYEDVSNPMNNTFLLLICISYSILLLD